MNKDRLHSVFKVILSLTVITTALVLTLVLAQNLREIEVFWPFSPSTGVVWFVCAVVLFLIVVYLLRLTRMTWLWSITGGASAIVIFSTLVSFLLQLLFALLEGMIRD